MPRTGSRLSPRWQRVDSLTHSRAAVRVVSNQVPVDIPLPAALVQQFNDLLADVRVALVQAIGERIQMQHGGRAAARVLGLDKTLGWRVFKTAYSSDEAGLLAVFPGRRAWGLVIEALQQLNFPTAAVAALERTLDELERFIEANGIPRHALLEWLHSLERPDEEELQMVALRKQAAEAYRASFGLYEQACMSATLIAPSSTAGLGSLAGVRLIDGPERNLTAGPHPIYRQMMTWNKEKVDRSAGQSSFPIGAIRAPLLPELSSEGLTDDELRVSTRHGRREFDFLGGRASRKEPMYFSFAEMCEAVGPMWSDGVDPEDRVESVNPIEIPCSRMVYDVLIHRDMPLGGPVEGDLYKAERPREAGDQINRQIRLRCNAKLVELDSSVVSASLGRRGETYRALLAHGAAMLGTTLADFRVYRIDIKYPPLSSVCVIGWPLPVRR